jgi:hypothetical protein
VENLEEFRLTHFIPHAVTSIIGGARLGARYFYTGVCTVIAHWVDQGPYTQSRVTNAIGSRGRYGAAAADAMSFTNTAVI